MKFGLLMVLAVALATASACSGPEAGNGLIAPSVGDTELTAIRDSEVCGTASGSDMEMCDFVLSESHGLLMMQPSGTNIGNGVAVFFDVGGPFRPKEVVAEDLADVVGQAQGFGGGGLPDVWLALYDFAPEITPDCQDALDDWLTTLAVEDLRVDACDLDQVAASYRQSEADSVAVALSLAGDPQVVDVWGASFAAARWTDLAETFPLRDIFVVSPLNAGSRQEHLVEQTAHMNEIVWDLRFRDACTTACANVFDVGDGCVMFPNCAIEEVLAEETGISPREVSYGLLGAAALFDHNSDVLVRTRNSDPAEFGSQLRRLAAGHLRTSVLGTASPVWVTHLAGVCSLTVGNLDNEAPANALKDAVAALFRPCEQLSGSGQYVIAPERETEPEEIETTSLCEPAPQPDLVLGNGTGDLTAHAPIKTQSYFVMDGWKGGHADLSVLVENAMQGCASRR